MSTYYPDLPAREVHERLRAAVAEIQRAERNAVLWFAEVLRRKLYRELGFVTIQHYAAEALGFSQAKTSQFIRLSESLDTLPRLRQAVASGEVSWTKARAIAAVATRKTEEGWVEEARRGSRRDLERRIHETRQAALALRRSPSARMEGGGQGVLPGGEARRPAPIAASRLSSESASAARPGSAADPGPRPAEVPVSVHLRLSPLQHARFEALVAKARALGLRGSREELVLEALETEVRIEAERIARERRRSRGRRKGDRTTSAEPADTKATRDDGGAAPAGEEAAPASEEAAPAAGEMAHPTQGPLAALGAAYQVVVYLCETCGSAHAPTEGGLRLLEPATIGSILCDAQISNGTKRRRSTIAPSVRRRVLDRDGHRCRMAGCGSRRNLRLHHRVPLALGGTDRPENMLTLCDRCHAWVHKKLINDLTTRWAVDFTRVRPPAPSQAQDTPEAAARKAEGARQAPPG
jgi:hypothetical protein